MADKQVGGLGIQSSTGLDDGHSQGTQGFHALSLSAGVQSNSIYIASFTTSSAQGTLTRVCSDQV